MKRISPSKSLVLSIALLAAALVCTPAFAAKKSKVAEDDGLSLLEMSDQLDGIDKQDFQEAIERATSCTRMRDFSCAESELAKAAKSANGGKDKKILLASRQSLAEERQELANEKRRAEEARRREEEERRREEEAEQERQARIRREEREAEVEEDSSYSASNDIGMHILQVGQQNEAILRDLNRQTTAAYAETNRRLAEQAAERKRAREEQEEREAERRRDAARERERSKRVADARERDEADARERRAAEESRARQEREQQRTSRPTQPSSVTLASSASSSTGSSAQNGATRTRQPHQPYADPDPYENHRNGWGGVHSSGKGQTREAACNEAKNNSQEEIARHSANWRFDAISPCVCSVNVGADRSVLDYMAETGQPDQWTCWQYEKKTQIRDLGNRSK